MIRSVPIGNKKKRTVLEKDYGWPSQDRRRTYIELYYIKKSWVTYNVIEVPWPPEKQIKRTQTVWNWRVSFRTAMVKKSPVKVWGSIKFVGGLKR